jgi:hypothetical protein
MTPPFPAHARVDSIYNRKYKYSYEEKKNPRAQNTGCPKPQLNLEHKNNLTFAQRRKSSKHPPMENILPGEFGTSVSVTIRIPYTHLLKLEVLVPVGYRYVG